MCATKTERVLSLVLLLVTNCASEWRQRTDPAAAPVAPAGARCDEVRRRELAAARGPLIAGYALLAVGAAAMIGGGVAALAVRHTQGPAEPSYVAPSLIAGAGLAMALIGMPLAYDGYEKTVEALPLCDQRQAERGVN